MTFDCKQASQATRRAADQFAAGRRAPLDVLVLLDVDVGEEGLVLVVHIVGHEVADQRVVKLHFAVISWHAMTRPERGRWVGSGRSVLRV